MRKTTVAERMHYVPLPVVIDGKVESVPIEPIRKLISSKPRPVILISGEGGSGKTTLACQLALAAMNDRSSPMIPLLLEPDILSNLQSAADLPNMIRGQLRAVISVQESLPAELVDQVLMRKRILVIVDGFSELPDAARKAFSPSTPDFLVSAVIMTSRREELLDGIPRTAVFPVRIKGDRLASFMEAYLQQIGKRHLFDDPEFFKWCTRLSVLVQGREITPLLTKLYAEHMVETVEAGSPDWDVQSIPDLMLSYINELNRRNGLGGIPDQEIHYALMRVAWECINETYSPSVARLSVVTEALIGMKLDPSILRYCEDHLGLIRTIGSSKDSLRLALDPLCEYLAAMYLIRVDPSGERVRDAVIMMEKRGLLHAGFYDALVDCCTNLGRRFGLTCSTWEVLMAFLEARRARRPVDEVLSRA